MFLDWVTPLNPPDRAQPQKIVSAGRGMTDSDWPSISILSLSSLAELSARMGLIPGLQPWLGLVWGVGLAWLLMTWTVFRQEGKPLGHSLGRIDFGFRVLVVAASAWLAIDAQGDGGVVAHAPWLGFKIALLGLSIAMGLVIRLQLRPFGPLLGKVVAGTASATDEAALQRLIAHVKVPVWVIWIALVIAAVLGGTHWSP